MDIIDWSADLANKHIYKAYLAKGIGFLHVCVCMCVCKCDCVGGCYVLFRNYNYVIYFKDKNLYQSTKTYWK